MSESPPPTLPLAEPAPITPFWQRMPRLFLFPLQRPALTTILVGTAAFAAGAALALAALPDAPLRAALLLLAAGAGSSLYVARFGFLVIERTAGGYLDARAYPRGEAAPHWLRPLKMLAVLVAGPLVIVVLGATLLPPLLLVAALLLFALLLPAAAMVLSRTDSIADALSPLQCASTARRIGPPYLLLCLFLFMLWLSSREAIAFLLGGAAPATGRGALGAALFVFSLVGNYFLVLTCALIGYVMYQYSAALGIDVVGPGETRRSAPASAAAHERRVREALIGKLIAGGEFREAMELLGDELRQRPGDLSLHVRLRTLLLHEGSRPRIEDHAQRYLELLLAAASPADALALYEQTRAMFPDFAPRDAGSLPDLAAAALGAGQLALAADLVRGFDRKHPGHPRVADAYLVGGRVLLQAGQSDAARQLFEYVARVHAGTPAGAEAGRYLARFSGGRAGGAAPATAAPAP